MPEIRTSDLIDYIRGVAREDVAKVIENDSALRDRANLLRAVAESRSDEPTPAEVALAKMLVPSKPRSQFRLLPFDFSSPTRLAQGLRSSRSLGKKVVKFEGGTLETEAKRQRGGEATVFGVLSLNGPGGMKGIRIECGLLTVGWCDDRGQFDVVIPQTEAEIHFVNCLAETCLTIKVEELL